jgi:hypothetical protein
VVDQETRERREKAREADRTLLAVLRGKLEANRTGPTLEDLMGRKQKAEAPPEEESEQS